MKKFVLLLFFATSACASLRVFVPNPRVEPPELRGDQGFKISGALVGAHEFKSTDDASSRPPNLNAPQTTTALDAYAGGLYSPIRQLEAGIELSPLHLGLNGVVKYQILGEGSRQASRGNVPLMIYVRAGGADMKNSGNQNGVFGAGGYNWRGSISESHLQGGLSSGYRVNEHVLLYAGLAYGQFWIRSEVDQDPGSSDAGGIYKEGYSGNGTSSGGGMLFNWRNVQFYVSGEVTHIDYNKTHEMQDTYLHAGIYITPGGGSAGGGGGSGSGAPNP